MNKIIFASIAIIFTIQMITIGFLFGGDKKLGGSTEDNWTVGGNLSITGTSALTATTTVSDSLILSGDGNWLGIATTTPAETLDVYNGNTTSTGYFYGTGVFGGSIILEKAGGGTCIEIKIDSVSNGISTSSVTCGSPSH